MKKIYILAAAAIAFAACDKNEDNPVSSLIETQISASIGDNTVSRASNTSWSKGDEIGISVSTGDSSPLQINMYYTTDGGEKFTGNPIYFYKPMTLTAYYPFTGAEGTVPGVDGVISANTLPGNQTSTTQPKIDFLWDRQTEIHVEDNTPEVHFNFGHKMSKITLIFEEVNESVDVSKIVSYEIDGLVMAGSFNTLTGDCSADDAAEAESFKMDLAEGTVVSGASLPSLIIFPQTVGHDSVTLKITDNKNQEYACKLNFKNDSLQSGNNYIFKISVTKTALVVNMKSISPWSDMQMEEPTASSTD